MSCVCHASSSVHCCLVVTCWERADLLALVVMFNWVFVTIPCGILGQVGYLIVSIPDLCRLSYFHPATRSLESTSLQIISVRASDSIKRLIPTVTYIVTCIDMVNKVTLCMPGNLSCCCRLLIFFSKLTFSKTNISGTHS